MDPLPVAVVESHFDTATVTAFMAGLVLVFGAIATGAVTVLNALKSLKVIAVDTHVAVNSNYKELKNENIALTATVLALSTNFARLEQSIVGKVNEVVQVVRPVLSPMEEVKPTEDKL